VAFWLLLISGEGSLRLLVKCQ